MKKLVSLLIVLLVILIPLTNAQLSNLQIKQVNINKDTRQIAILVESNLNKELYQLRFIITDIGNNKDTIISTIPLQAYTSNWYYITYSNKLKDLKNIQVEDLNQEYTASYKFTSKEPSFVQEQVQIEQVQTPSTETLPSKTSYIYSNNQLVAKKVNNNIQYYHSDQISSTSIITDSSSNIVYSSDYLPFGTSFNTMGKERYTYTGKEQDYSNLYYYGARYYDPNIGRFTQVDPMQDYSTSSYTYVGNNPLIRIDPSGMQEINPPATADTSSFVDFKFRVNWDNIGNAFMKEVYDPSIKFLKTYFVKSQYDDITPIGPKLEESNGWRITITQQVIPDTTLTKPDTTLTKQQKSMSKKEEIGMGLALIGIGSVMLWKAYRVLTTNRYFVGRLGVTLNPISVGEAYTNPEKYLESVNRQLNEPGFKGVVNRIVLSPQVPLIEYSKQVTALPPGSI